VVNLALLACVLRATTKKGHQLFEEISAPPEKILATPAERSEKFAIGLVPTRECDVVVRSGSVASVCLSL